MSHHAEEATLAYSADELFAIVADTQVKHYPLVPCCQTTRAPPPPPRHPIIAPPATSSAAASSAPVSKSP